MEGSFEEGTTFIAEGNLHDSNGIVSQGPNFSALHSLI